MGILIFLDLWILARLMLIEDYIYIICIVRKGFMYFRRCRFFFQLTDVLTPASAVLPALKFFLASRHFLLQISRFFSLLFL